MKVCKKCGARYDGDQKFCKVCGEPLVEEKKKSNLWIFILIGILAVALISGSIAAVKIYENKKQGEREREEEEIREQEEEAVEEAKEEKKKEGKEEKEDTEETEQSEEEARASAETNTGVSAGNTTTVSGTMSKTSSLYDSWKNRLVNAENTDAQLVSQSSSASDFNGRMSKQQERYNLWDALLNEMWQDLKKALPESTMEQLTDEQVDWIHEKEATVSSYWSAQNVDYSAFPNAPAADTTRERVYYLLNMCPMN